MGTALVKIQCYQADQSHLWQYAALFHVAKFLGRFMSGYGRGYGAGSPAKVDTYKSVGR